MEELKTQIIEMGGKPHCARQIFNWIYKKHTETFESMTDISPNFKCELEKQFLIDSLEEVSRLKSSDGTLKFLFRLNDKEYIESVLIKEKKRRTLCVSSQVGCRIKCPFCASGQLGFKRNLSPAEIIDQVVVVERLEKLRISNIVFMGIGEPLDNFDNVIKAIKIINSKESLEVGARKITVSTCGILPEIMKLKETALQVELSISLHAVSDKLRDRLVPINKKYPLKELIKVCRKYFEETNRIITLEYTLISGVNDSLADAKSLASIAGQINGKVNLISCNSFSGYDEKGVTENKINEFRR